MSAFKPNTFYLFELRNTSNDNHPFYFIMNDSPEDGSFQISDALIFKEILSNEDIIQRNKSNYYKSLKIYAEYISHQEPSRISSPDKIDIRLEYFRLVKARYIDWFLRNNIALDVELELETIARENSLKLEGIDLTNYNERMITIIRLLNSKSHQTVKGSELLIQADSMLDTVTSYTRLSEVFKTNRQLFKAFIKTTSKGFYQIR